MPAKSPPVAHAAARQLELFGRRVHGRGKALKVSAATAAEAAGMSRATLHRIEAGDPSVTIGAYLNAMAALGMAVDIVAAPKAETEPAAEMAAAGMPAAIRVADYPQLHRLAWQLPEDALLTPGEALGLYERNWRHVDRTTMGRGESDLLEALVRGPGRGRLLV
ncbi:MAG TPA: helix-turn-helix domain-containing protein [Variovorax sp.]